MWDCWGAGGHLHYVCGDWEGKEEKLQDTPCKWATAASQLAILSTLGVVQARKATRKLLRLFTLLQAICWQRLSHDWEIKFTAAKIMPLRCLMLPGSDELALCINILKRDWKLELLHLIIRKRSLSFSTHGSPAYIMCRKIAMRGWIGLNLPRVYQAARPAWPMKETADPLASKTDLSASMMSLNWNCHIVTLIRDNRGLEFRSFLTSLQNWKLALLWVRRKHHCRQGLRQLTTFQSYLIKRSRQDIFREAFEAAYCGL